VPVPFGIALLWADFNKQFCRHRTIWERAIAGQVAPIYVREVVRADTALRSGTLANRVVLFVHGAGTPAEVSFDVPYQDYSWMEYLARAGFDTFAMDTTGYGRSHRPAAMNDPCNLSAEQRSRWCPADTPNPVGRPMASR
jgi:alpha-beta hydrolase superfamily lysophospholipase